MFSSAVSLSSPLAECVMIADRLIMIRKPVVRACINMEYPPRLQIQENGDWVWDSETGEDGMEKVPDQEYQKQGYGLVHFDLDPSNGESPRVLSYANCW